MPAFNISNFRTHLDQRGTLLTNKFNVEFGIPVVLQNTKISRYTNIEETLNFRAEQIRLPGVSLDPFQVNRYGLGPSIKFPTNVNFTDISITFIEDRDVTLWKFHNEWISWIFDYTGNKSNSSTGPYTLQYRKNYVIDIIINIYNNDSETFIKSSSTIPPEPTTSIVLKEAYPLSINDINLDWSQNNTLFKPTVTYTFKSWYIRDFIRTSSEYRRKSTDFDELFYVPSTPSTQTPSAPTLQAPQVNPTTATRQRPIILP